MASVLGHATAATTDRPEKTFQKAFHNAFGPVPGLLRHVRGKIGLPPAKQVGSFRVRDIDPLALQVLTYANSAYWPVTKVLLKSLRYAFPNHHVPPLRLLLCMEYSQKVRTPLRWTPFQSRIYPLRPTDTFGVNL